jgi:hypothetical protein
MTLQPLDEPVGQEKFGRSFRPTRLPRLVGENTPYNLSETRHSPGHYCEVKYTDIAASRRRPVIGCGFVGMGRVLDTACVRSR